LDGQPILEVRGHWMFIAKLDDYYSFLKKNYSHILNLKKSNYFHGYWSGPQRVQCHGSRFFKTFVTTIW
jgi:hypothetical protein